MEHLFLRDSYGLVERTTFSILTRGGRAPPAPSRERAILPTRSQPLTTSPKIVWRPFSQGVGTSVMKN
jgi:hypothetical protein